MHAADNVPDPAQWALEDEVFAGRFRIEREAGVGGMGIVYRTLDQTSGDVVALKLLRHSDTAALRRFDAEVEALEKLRHPAIVRYVAHGIGEEDQRYLAMEWVDGETLGQKLRRGPLDVREVVALGQRLADALAAAHEAGILHRDLKPSNVLLPGGDIAAAKLADFGLARCTFGGGSTHATASGVIVGTPGYIAPEQAHAVADLDGRADLFSLGCLLFRCLADVEAFDGSRVLTALAKLLLHEPPRLTAFCPRVPADLDHLVASLLAKDREQRPASAAHVRDALAAIRVDDLAEHRLADVTGPALKDGVSFGRYVLEGSLGAGGMGELFRARDTVLGRSVALKVLRGPRDHKGRETLLREARAAAALTHTNVVTIHDVGEHEGVPFLAMEHIAGKTLRAHIGDASVDMAKRVRWLVEMARGLAAAHKAGLIHGDVTPDNVMIAEDGRVKILDFGLSAAAPGDIVGTPAYMAPEQIRGEPLDGRADQFSWGVTAYELLTGHLPWANQDVVATLASVLFEEVGEGELPSEMADAVRTALRKGREDRFATMDALLATIEERVSLASVPPPAKGRGWKSVALTGGEVLMVGAVLMVLVAAWRGRGNDAAPVVAAPSAAAAAVSEAKESIPALSRDPEAAAEIAAGLQHWRDGSDRTAERSFARAIERDSSAAAAHLYSSMIPTWTDEAVRAHHHAASAHRVQLGARDRALLEAYAPAMAVPPDYDASAERLRAAREAFPSDWLVAYALGDTQIKRGEHRKAIAIFDELLGRDPSLAAAWSRKSVALALLDDVNTREALRECLKVSPNADTCLSILMRLDAHEGLCEDSERHARTMMASPLPSGISSVYLASAMHARGKSMESVHDVLEQAWRLVPTKRDMIRWRNVTRFHVVSGAFQEAQHAMVDWAKAIATSRYEEDHASLAEMRFNMSIELGQPALARRLAGEYLAKRDAWIPDVYIDKEILPLGVQYRTGGMGRDVFQTRRQAWLARQADAPRLSGTLNQRWIYGYAVTALTREDATEALAALPGYQPLTVSYSRDVSLDLGIGRTYLLANDLENALTYLRRGAHSCTAIFYPFEHAWANLYLGRALEQRGDVSDACAAYAVVLSRWGQEPRSVSAKEARSRRAALRCASP